MTNLWKLHSSSTSGKHWLSDIFHVSVSFRNKTDKYLIFNLNFQFVFEGMEESGSEGLEDLLKAQKDKFLAGTDYVCISDNYWLGKNKPCITYGLRGICYFCIEVRKSKCDFYITRNVVSNNQ